MLLLLLLVSTFQPSSCLQDCSLEVVEIFSFLHYRCRNTLLLKCPFTDEYYSTSKILIGRDIEQTTSAVCQNDTKFYQACGLKEIEVQTGENTEEGSLCGYLCQMIVKTPVSPLAFLYVNNKVASTLAWSPARNYRPKTCNGVEECANTNLDERGCENSQGEIVSYFLNTICVLRPEGGGKHPFVS